MAIQNRDHAAPEQREVLYGAKQALVVTGASVSLLVVPYPCNVQAAAFAAYGLSGAPGYMLQAHRWTSSGATVIDLGVSAQIMSVATGVSGPAAGWSGIRTLGSSLLQLQQGDVLKLTSSVANTAALEVAVAVVVQKTQDIVSALGLSS